MASEAPPHLEPFWKNALQEERVAYTRIASLDRVNAVVKVDGTIPGGQVQVMMEV